jgi:hypothetical protein
MKLPLPNSAFLDGSGGKTNIPGHDGHDAEVVQSNKDIH